MLDSAITDFFDQRKEVWLKKNISSTTPQDKIHDIEEECKKNFDLTYWLPDAAKRAGQITIATHPCTFSHPSARKNKNGYVTSTIFDKARKADGYLRTGNVSVEPDALGNAAALDVYKFLNIKLSDGLTLLQHIDADTGQAKELLAISTATYEELKSGFLAMVQVSEGELITSSKIKQVYFPVEKDYHQFSVLTNSGLVFELRQRLDSMRFSEEIKAKRELKKSNQYSDQGYCEIYDLTTIGYGGTKPQNISVLNNQNGGKAHLLASVPPSLQVRNIRFPIKSFFNECLYFKDFSRAFHKFHAAINIKVGGDIPRQKIIFAINNAIKDILLEIMESVYRLRSVSSAQYHEGSSLSHAQTIWLCENKFDERESSSAWLEEIIPQCVRWIINGYSKAFGNKHILLGNAEFTEINEIIEQWLMNNQEFLR